MRAETTAKPEYCDHCGGRLESVRTLILHDGSWRFGQAYSTVHPHCVEAFKASHAKPLATDTTAGRP